MLYTNTIISEALRDSGTIPTNGLAKTLSVADRTATNRDVFLVLKNDTQVILDVLQLTLRKPPAEVSHWRVLESSTLVGVVTGLLSGFLLSLAQPRLEERRQTRVSCREFDSAFTIVRATLVEFWDYDERTEGFPELPALLTVGWLTSHATHDESWEKRVVVA